MESAFDKRVNKLYNRACEFVNVAAMYKAKRDGEKFEVNIPNDFKEEFYKLIDIVNLGLMEDENNFYGYFLFQMKREIRFDILSPTGVNFKGAKYVIYFNPSLFLQLNLKQMEATIKHEIHHILSLHLVRASELKGKVSTLAMNLAMDLAVNQFIDNMPEYAITLEWINTNYSLSLEPYNTFEYYAEMIQNELNLIENSKKGEEDDTRIDNDLEPEYDPEKTHDLWDESDEIDKRTIQDFTEKFAKNAEKGKIPSYLKDMISTLKNSKGELPWNLYLKKLMGTIESNKKKTITRRNRRQPNRLDLRGELRGHKANIAVAIDISGSISDEEFKQAIKEVLAIVKTHNNEITIIECDKEIRRTYKIKSENDIKERMAKGGATKFTPVFEYANKTNLNLLIYFTDGKGEESLGVIPKGSYKTLWVISGRGDNLSLKQSYGTVKKLSKVEYKDNFLEIQDVRTDGYSMQNQEPTLKI